MKETSIPPVTEENWMNGCLISNHFTQTNHNPNHEMITNDLRNLEQELTLQFHALYYLINQIEIRIAVKKLKNNKSFSAKRKNKRVTSAVK